MNSKTLSTLKINCSYKECTRIIINIFNGLLKLKFL